MPHQFQQGVDEHVGEAVLGDLLLAEQRSDHAHFVPAKFDRCRMAIAERRVGILNSFIHP
ncbi:MAG: hypothetical protein IPJ87_09875 [Flavobacteriales bacterium]|nr:hypothetical protein [Flavobacteriales bacterium]